MEYYLAGVAQLTSKWYGKIVDLETSLYTPISVNKRKRIKLKKQLMTSLVNESVPVTVLKVLSYIYILTKPSHHLKIGKSGAAFACPPDPPCRL